MTIKQFLLYALVAFVFFIHGVSVAKRDADEALAKCVTYRVKAQ